MRNKRTDKTPLEDAYVLLRHRLKTLGNTYRIPEEDMSDMLQDSYLRLADQPMDKMERAHGKLFITLRNLMLDRLRLSSRRKNVPLEDINALSDDSDIDSEEKKEWLMKMVTLLLTPLQAKIMTMLVEDDMDYPEIASALHLTEGAVRTNISRARKILNEKLRNGK